MEKRYKGDPNLVITPAYYAGGIPVFKPSLAQFQDFYKFNKAVNHYGMKSGIIKIIPPPEWHAELSSVYTAENLNNVVIRNPIVQNVNSTAGFKGVYSSQNVERQRKYSLSQWLQLSKKPNHQPPAHNKRRSLPGPASDPNTPNTRAKDGHRSKRSNKDKLRETLDSHFNIDISEFTDERCNELEQMYWRSLGYAEPMYGADVLGSLFHDSIKSWNVAHLPNLLDLMDEKVPGVNDAYLYAGLWKATFSWHLEDQDLYSINYLHFGAPKQWYSISQEDSTRFYNLMKEIFDEDYKNCSEFLRHKTFMASPAFLEKNGINCNKIVHNQGEFIITYPYGYHSGFNYGYNLAESVNFALDEWFEYAAKTKKCLCIGDSVGIDYKQILCKFKGVPYDISDSTIYDEELRNSQRANCKPVKRKRATAPKSQCVLCPIDLPKEMLKFRQFELVPCDAGLKTGEEPRVHRICSEAFPQYLSESETNRITGINDITRSYRTLKCLHCHLPNKYSASGISQGACFQCSAGTCSKSYHPICALSSGFLFNNQTCKVHRRASSKFYERQNADYINLLSQLTGDSLIQFSDNAKGKRHIGEMWSGLVQSNSIEGQFLEVLKLPSLEERVRVQYDQILLGDSQDTDNSKFWNMEIVPTSPKSPLVPDIDENKVKRSEEKSVKDESVKKAEENRLEQKDGAVKRASLSGVSLQRKRKKSENLPKVETCDPRMYNARVGNVEEVKAYFSHPKPMMLPAAATHANLAQMGAHPHQMNQFLPCPPMPAHYKSNYTFQHPRTFSDSSSWLLPMTSQAVPGLINHCPVQYMGYPVGGAPYPNIMHYPGHNGQNLGASQVPLISERIRENYPSGERDESTMRH